ncbi:hypothetical protein C8Q75DRAFT_810989 [Abortiporus biennis]|nr:hypothetical protein C8Q75DRAFT_810989 [Abortiporus biennis]
MHHHLLNSEDSTSSTGTSNHYHVLPNIHRLPVELLVCIFDYGGLMTLQESDSRRTAFIVRISLVCKRWRTVIFSTPSVWRNIPIFDPSNLVFTRTFIDKSDGYPLNIFVHAKGNGVSETLQMLGEHSSRWSSLFIRVASAPCLFLAMSSLRKLPAPKLNRLEIYVDALPSSVGQIPPIFLSNTSSESSQQPSLGQLTTLRLDGTSFDFKCSLMHGLTSLSLSRLPREMGQPNYIVFRDLLSSSPKLTHLALDGVFPRLLPDIEYEDIHPPSLISLELTIIPGNDYIQQFFQILNLPLLKSFSYTSGWNIAWDHFEFGLPVLSKKFNNRLEELKLLVATTEVFAEDGIDTDFFFAFPNLKYFNLSAFNDAAIAYFIRPWVECTMDPRPRDGSTGQSVVWGNLALLTIRAPFDDTESVDGFDEELGVAESLDDLVEMLGSLRLSLGLPFDVYQKCIFDDFGGLQSPPMY